MFLEAINSRFFQSNKKKLKTILDSRLNSTNNPSGLEEYVDILQVQQLLLDSTPSTLTSTSTITTSNATVNSTNSIGISRHRPRVNIQKASEYSTTMANNTTVCPSTPSAQLQGTSISIMLKIIHFGKFSATNHLNKI